MGSRRASASHLWLRGLGAAAPRKQGLTLLGALAMVTLGIPAYALSVSVREHGIDARRLQEPPYSLTGRKIAIGQVEGGRPALFGLDKLAVPNGAVRPAQVF